MPHSNGGSVVAILNHHVNYHAKNDFTYPGSILSLVLPAGHLPGTVVPAEYFPITGAGGVRHDGLAAQAGRKTWICAYRQ